MSMTLHAHNKATDDLLEGPNFSNANCAMILRSLDLPVPTDGVVSLDRRSLHGAALLGSAVGGGIEDDGQPDIRVGNMIDCGVRPGYFADAYAAIVEFCQLAAEHGVDEVYFA